MADGLGDTVRVSLTEDPEFELVPCAKLIEIGTFSFSHVAIYVAYDLHYAAGNELLTNDSKFKDIPVWKESHRNITAFSKRKGSLPAQMEGDETDIRGYLHRDGSVFSYITKNDLKNPDFMYRQLGTKSVVGMPFKDIATSDSLYLSEVPTDAQSRKALKRLQDISVGVFADINQLNENPLPNSVAVVSLDKTSAGLPPLPPGSIRFAIKVTGIEPESAYNILKNVDPRVITIIIEVPSHVSRVHASRRIFQLLVDRQCVLPVIHHLAFSSLRDKDELILRSGNVNAYTDFILTFYLFNLKGQKLVPY